MTLQTTSSTALSSIESIQSIGFLGPSGSHSHDSLKHWLNNNSNNKQAKQIKENSNNTAQAVNNIIPYNSLRQLCEAGQAHQVDAIWLPVENALEGSITESLEFTHLSSPTPHILGEWLTPIQHCLIQKGARESGETPQHITSHPQALSQCRDTLYQQFGPNLQFHPASSTSQAVTSLQQHDNSWAALGSKTAADENNLTIIHSNMSDSPHNSTRFHLLSWHSPTTFSQYLSAYLHHPSQKENEQNKSIKTSLKTSLCLGLKDRPGALVDLLLVFKAYNITMTRIESRPARQKMGDYLFYIDVADDLTQDDHAKVRMYLEAESDFLAISNAYPSFINDSK